VESTNFGYCRAALSRLFDARLSRHRLCCLVCLDDCHAFSLSLLSGFVLHPVLRLLRFPHPARPKHELRVFQQQEAGVPPKPEGIGRDLRRMGSPSRPIRRFLRGDFRGGGSCKHFVTDCLARASGEEVGNSESAESNSYCLHLIHLPLLRFHPEFGSARGKTTKGIMLGWSDRHGFRGNALGRSSLHGVLPVSKIHRRVVCNLCVSKNFRSLWR